MDDFGIVNEVYKKFFTKDFPARAAYQVFLIVTVNLSEF